MTYSEKTVTIHSDPQLDDDLLGSSGVVAIPSHLIIDGVEEKDRDDITILAKVSEIKRPRFFENIAKMSASERVAAFAFFLFSWLFVALCISFIFLDMGEKGFVTLTIISLVTASLLCANLFSTKTVLYYKRAFTFNKGFGYRADMLVVPKEIEYNGENRSVQSLLAECEKNESKEIELYDILNKLTSEKSEYVVSPAEIDG